MNYYERYCGDYAKKTGRLTLVQHGAYTLLLDEYYSTEQPLASNFEELYRICRAMNKAEREAVRTVAEQFFPIGDDGLRHNDRADEMIEKARQKIEAARNNGKKGGRPKNPAGSKNGKLNGTREEPSGFSSVADEGWDALNLEAENVPNLIEPQHRFEVAEKTEYFEESHTNQAERKPTGFPQQNPAETQRESSPTPTNTTEAKASAADAAPGGSDLKAMIFSIGVQLLVTAGGSESSARSFLGKHAKGGEAKLAQVIGYLAANPKIEPKAYIAAAMAPKKATVVL